ASLYQGLGDSEKAFASYQQSLRVFRELGDRRGQATTLNNIGVLSKDRGENQQALDYFVQALPLWRETRGLRGEAATLSNMGLAYTSLGDRERALEPLTKALAVTRAIRYRAGELSALAGIAQLERQAGHLREALARNEMVLDILESLRSEISGPELRTSLFANRRKHYDFRIDLLIQMHKQEPTAEYDLRALEVSERARARSLLDLLAEARVDLREGVDPKLLAREQDLQRQLDLRAEGQMQGLSVGKGQTASAEKEIEALTVQY